MSRSVPLWPMIALPTGDSFERRFSAQFAQHWAQVRAERRQVESESELPSIGAGESNFRPAQVPYALDLAAAWSWRFLVIVAAGALIVWALAEGRACAAGVDAYLTGSTTLPKPIKPTERPVTV